MGNCVGKANKVSKTKDNKIKVNTIRTSDQIHKNRSRFDQKFKATYHHYVKQNDKSAVLVGLNYPGTESSLQGCINDANRMAQTLRYKFNYSDVTVLTDRNLSRYNNILQVLDNLVDSKNKTLFFQYSGHGTQVPDYNGDESDGEDEALYSVHGTIITDDQINKRVRKIKKGTTLIMVIDACHSGSMVDLPYQLLGNQVINKNNNKIEGNVICVSGCRDDQVSMDISNNDTAYGAMSNALQAVINREDVSKITWRDLVSKLRQELNKDRFAQVPQLSVSDSKLIDSVISL